MKEDLPLAARALGVSIQAWEVRDTHDFERVFAALSKGRPDGLYVPRTLIMSVRLIVAFYTLVDLF